MINLILIIVLNSIMIYWIKTLLEFSIRINKANNNAINKLCLKFMNKISNSIKIFIVIVWKIGEKRRKGKRGGLIIREKDLFTLIEALKRFGRIVD